MPFVRLSGLTPQSVRWNPISGALGAESRSRCRCSRYCGLGGGSGWSANAAECLSIDPPGCCGRLLTSYGGGRGAPSRSKCAMWIYIRVLFFRSNKDSY